MTRKGLLRAVYTAVSAVLALAAWQVMTVTPPSTGVSCYQCAGSNGSRLAVATTNADGSTPVQFATSTDGTTWTTVTSNLPADTACTNPVRNVYGVSQISGNGTFWLARTGGAKVYRSTDLQTWTLAYTAASGAEVSFVYAGPTVSLVAGATSAGAAFCATSTDGTTWTARTPPVYQTKAGCIRQAVTVGNTVYAYMAHGNYPQWQVVWSSTDGGVTWSNEYVVTPVNYGEAYCAVALGSTPAFGLRYQRVLAKVGGTWQVLRTGPNGQIERRPSYLKAPAKFADDGVTDYAATPVVGLGTVRNEIVAALQPCIGMWSSNWPQVARFYDGANWTDQTAQLSGSSVTMEGRSKAVLLPADADDALYLGNRDGLRAVGWELSAAGSYTGLRLEYSTATGWARLRATDTTAGLTQSGSMVWAMPKDWARVSLPGQPANLRALRWVRLVCDGCTTRAGGSLTGYWEQQEPLYTGGLYRVGGEPLQPWNASLEIDCLLPLGKRLFAVCYDPDGTQPASVVEVR